MNFEGQWQSGEYISLFDNTQGVTTLKVVMVADEAFEEMMNAWTEALRLLKELCEH